jgi:hypothetical protein
VILITFRDVQLLAAFAVLTATIGYCLYEALVALPHREGRLSALERPPRDPAPWPKTAEDVVALLERAGFSQIGPDLFVSEPLPLDQWAPLRAHATESGRST